MTSIYFVRHAQPDHGWENDRSRPLSEEGKCAGEHNVDIKMDERLREREKGPNGNNSVMFQKRWADFDYHEEGGESLSMVQERNIQAVFDILDNHFGENVLVGTHGTALSTILNYFEPAYNCDSFLRIIDFMPYIIRLDFEGRKCVGKEELLVVKKEYKGKHQEIRAFSKKKKYFKNF